MVLWFWLTCCFAASSANGFVFEMPVVVAEEPAAIVGDGSPQSLVTLVLPPKGKSNQRRCCLLKLTCPKNKKTAWESLSQQLSFRDLARCASTCKVWRTTMSQSIKVVTVASSDGARVKVRTSSRLCFCFSPSLLLVTATSRHCSKLAAYLLCRLSCGHSPCNRRRFPLSCAHCGRFGS